jgi:hypothetical protein
VVVVVEVVVVVVVHGGGGGCFCACMFQTVIFQHMIMHAELDVLVQPDAACGSQTPSATSPHEHARAHTHTRMPPPV